jgi:hypothetical protein
MSAIGVIDPQLRQQPRRRRQERIPPQVAHQAAAEPTLAQHRAHGVRAAGQHGGHIVGLVDHALGVFGELRGEQILADLFAVQKHPVAAQRRDIQARRLDRFRNAELAPEKRRRTRKRSALDVVQVRYRRRLPLRLVFPPRLPPLAGPIAFESAIRVPDFQQPGNHRSGSGDRDLDAVPSWLQKLGDILPFELSCARLRGQFGSVYRRHEAASDKQVQSGIQGRG